MKKLRIYLVPLLVAALLLPACKEEVEKKEMIRPVKSVRVPEQSRILSGRSFPGKATATQQTNLAFRVAVEQNDYIGAASLNQLGMRIPNLNKEWKGFFKWYLGLSS